MSGLKGVKWLQPVIRIGGKIVKFGKQNSNWVLAVLAMLGLAGTTALAIDATVKAVKICEEKKVSGKKEIIKTVWRLYIPTIGCFLVTTMSIVSNAHLNNKVRKQLVAMTGLYAMRNADFKALKEKATEIVGPRKEEKMEDEIAKDRLNKVVPMQQSQIIETGHGDKLFLEWLTGQLIRTSPEHVEAVSVKIDARLDREIDGVVEVGGVYLSEFNIPPDCWVGEAIWDAAEMRQQGINKFEINCQEIQWMTVNGKQEMVGIIRPPRPSGV